MLDFIAKCQNKVVYKADSGNVNNFRCQEIVSKDNIAVSENG